MKIVMETSLERFEAWSGAVDTLDTLIEKGLCDRLEKIIECDIFPDGCTDTELNDLLWFERDAIAEWLGFYNWDSLENDGEEEEEEELDYEEGVTEMEFETIDNFCNRYSTCYYCPYNSECATYEDCKNRFETIVNGA